MEVIRDLENRLLKGTTGIVINQEEGLLNFLWPLMWVGLPLMRSVPSPSAKTVLMLLGLTSAAIQKKCFVSGMTTWIISNEEMVDIMILVKSLEDLVCW